MHARTHARTLTHTHTHIIIIIIPQLPHALAHPLQALTLMPTLLVGAVGASSRTITTTWGLVALAMWPACAFLCWLVRQKLV